VTSRAALRLRHLGLLVQVPGGLAVVTLPVCALAGEAWALGPFAVTAALALAAGQALVRTFPSDVEATPREAMTIAALAWLVVPLVAALPILLLGRSEAARDAFPEVAVFGPPLHAAFEAFSGFTSTGLTMSAHPSALPHSLQWWRSLMQWVGGMGVVVLMLAVVHPGGVAPLLYRAEAREEKILPTVKSTVRAYLGIYVALTLVGMLALLLAGAPPWQAVNHGFTAIATGGFTVTDRGDVLPAAVQAVLVALMVAGAFSFAAYGRLWRERRPAALVASGQHRLLCVLLVFFAAALAFESRVSQGTWRVGESVFQGVSALCTAGFQTAHLESWTEGSKLLIVLAMTLGGAAGSTAGGIKLARVYALAKGVQWRFRSLSLGRHEILRHDLDGRGVSREEAMQTVEAAAVLAVAWIATHAAATLLLLHVAPAGTTLGDVMLEAASAQGNVGLSTGITSAELPATGKLLLMGLMWMGRLEILPVLILVIPSLRPRLRWLRR